MGGALHQAGQTESLGGFAHFFARDFSGFREGLVDGGEYHVFEQLGIGGIDGLGIDFDGGKGAFAPGHNFDRSAAAAGFNGAGGQLGLDFLQLLLGAGRLFHEFSEIWHVYLLY